MAAFIHHTSFGGDFLEEAVTFMQSLGEKAGVSHEDIHGKAGGDFLVDLLGGVHPKATRFGDDDEEIHIGIRGGIAVCV